MNPRGAYHEEFRDNATFREWDYVDNIFDTLYNNSQAVDVSIGSNALNDTNKTDNEKNEIENLEGHQHYELQESLMFHNWEHAMNEIKKYEKREGFRTRCYRIEKLKNGEVRRRTLVCEYFGHLEATKSKDPRKETTTKRVGCIQQINLSCPEKDNPHKLIYVAKLINEHKNHDLDQVCYNFQKNITFTTEMTEDVKFFVTKMNCSPQQIRKALEEKYFVKVYMPVL